VTSVAGAFSFEPNTMTKQIRIENADTTSHKARVRVEEKNAAGEWVDRPELACELAFPTAMTSATVHTHRRLVVEEALPAAAA